MKNGPGTTTTISLTQTTETCFCAPPRNRKMLNPFLSALRSFFSSYKEQIHICLATAAIGAIFLGSILIFFTQLAEYGW